MVWQEEPTMNLEMIATAAADNGMEMNCYRFLPPAGTRIAEEAPGYAYCGTIGTGWMQGSHPTSLGETVTRTVCFQGSSSLPCWRSTEIKVRNCGQYFLYRLVDTPICYLGYCANSH